LTSGVVVGGGGGVAVVSTVLGSVVVVVSSDIVVVVGGAMVVGPGVVERVVLSLLHMPFSSRSHQPLRASKYKPGAHDRKCGNPSLQTK
jgi:hypothetical protein